MIAKFIAWLLELFRPKPKKLQELEKQQEKLEEQLEEIDNEEITDDELIDHFRK